MRRALLSLTCLLALGAGCSNGGKAPVDEDFSDLAGADEKSDAFSYRMKILGSLDYGQTSATVAYKSTPRFRAFKFAGHKGDQIDVWVRSTNGGDALAWVLDNKFNVVAQNDDALEGGTLDSHITVTLPGNTDANIVTHYIVLRDYDLHAKKFTVQLSGKNNFFSCTADSDCVAVPLHACCPNCRKAAVNKDQTDAYAAQPQICTMFCTALCVLEERVPQCNFGTGQCEMIAVADIACGGHTPHPHGCPDGLECQGSGLVVDAPGHCLPPAAPVFCGGIAGIACPAGLTCVDNPDDSCDPAHGGADCGGICQ